MALALRRTRARRCGLTDQFTRRLVKLLYAPGPQIGNVQDVPEDRRADAGFDLDLVQRRIGRGDEAHGDFTAGVPAVVYSTVSPVSASASRSMTSSAISVSSGVCETKNSRS